MKKSLLLTVFAIGQLLGFSQEKHITFLDSLLAPASSVYYNNFQLANSNSNVSDGYFIGAGYDDFSYNLKHYIGKVDFQGGLLWDTILYFQEPFGDGYSYPNLKFAQTSTGVLGYANASAVNVNITEQAFIYHVTDNGEVDWNQYYSNDTVRTTIGEVIETTDGGYAITGEIFDFNGNGLSNSYGFLYKTDVSGNLEWSKWYADKDTAEFSFSSIAQTASGDYIVAGNGINNKMSGQGKGDPQAFDNFITVANLDQNGDLIRNSVIHFDSIADLGSSFQEIVVNIVEDQTAIVTFKYYNNNTFYYDLGIASVDISTGNVNWVKGYSLSTFIDMNPKKVVISKDNTILVFQDENYEMLRTILYEIDLQGNVLQSISIDDGSDVSIQDVILNNDGGFLMSYYPSVGSSVANLLKTDNMYSSYCGLDLFDVDPDMYDLTFTTFEIIDTVLDVSLVTGTINVVADSVVDFNNDKYCSCELTIAGTIIEPSMGSSADSVLVTLYKFDPSPGQYVVYDTITADTEGVYHFDFLPAGDYVIKAEPSQIKYPDLVKTYYNGVITATQWDSAEVIMVQCGINPMTYDFTLFQGVPQAGTWTCNGYVYEYFGFNPTNKLAPGDPIGDIDITVEQSPGGAISSTTTDPSGYYEFTGLNNNATFIVRADIPGLPNDSIYTLTINPGDGGIDSLNFYVDSVGVYIVLEDIFTSVKSNESQNLSYNLLPNPTKGMVNLVVETDDAVEVSLVVTNVIGETIFNNVYNASSGVNKYPIDLTNYNQGIYFVRISQGNDYIIKKIIKQ